MSKTSATGQLSISRFLRAAGALLLIGALLLSAPEGRCGWGAPTRAATAPREGETRRVIEVRADAFGLPLADDAIARLYDKPSVRLHQGDRIQVSVFVEEEGDYTVWFDMAAAESVVVTPPEGQLWVDGRLPVADARRIIFPVYYRNTTDEFPLDRYGNEILIPQEQHIRWTKAPMRDINFSQAYPLQVHLTAGKHSMEFILTRESALLGSIYLEPFSPYRPYREYLQDHPSPDSSGVLIEIEAERPSYKNNVSIRPLYNRSLDVTPYDTYRLLLNTIGGESWQQSGSALYYEFTVPEDGMYCITLRALQNYKSNFTIFRRITINDEVPFEEFNEVAFPYSPQWHNITLGGDAPFRVFLHKGLNTLGLEATTSPYDVAIQNIRKIIADISALSLDIKRLTGNQVDPYREWKIADYIPNIDERLSAIVEALQADRALLSAINQGLNSAEIMNYQMALDNILFLARDPDKIPVRMNRLSEGPQSAIQLLGGVLSSLQKQPLALDKIYIHSPDTPPQPPRISPAKSLTEGMKRFLHSFTPNPYQSIGAREGEIEVWVNRPRQYVDLMQTMADQTFTPRTGIPVKFSLMPNESKLALAIAANIEPDVALGISTNIPFELALRNALKDLRSFPDFDSFIRIYSPGSLLGYVINDSVYAIPETQDFWVTYYRKDILQSLGLSVPHTWNEVLKILPELQLYGMNYATPLSIGTGIKGYLITAPYIFNHGAHLYSPDGYSTGLGSDAAITAIKFMAEQFTVYGMPLTVSSFYESFRNGTIPIGISNFETYVKLTAAAPEIEGLWGIDLYPATVLPDGTQNRYATGSAQVCIMLADTDKPNESWEFLKWWMSTETQREFQQQILLNYGPEYLWNSANVEAFKALPIPQEHKEVILKQWEWLQEPVKLPGSYIQERELSNVWNRIVFQGVNPRVAIDDAIITINREMARKMEQLGYIRNGQRVMEFKIPTIETVRQWMQGSED
ncbi:MAG: extracellular solute-binding protein [Anaerolineales bacterium]